METDDPLSEYFIGNIDIVINPLNFEIVGGLICVFILLCASAMVSGAEVAFFSLSPQDLLKIENRKSKRDSVIMRLINIPERLLGTILITNNFVNIGIVMLSTFLTNSIFDFSSSPILGRLFEVVGITFLLLLFGEILPKVYAAQHSLKFASFMSFPINIFEAIFRPFSQLLAKSTNIVNKRFQKKQNLSIDDLSEALDLTEGAIAEEKDILMGIVKFSNTDVTEIMRPRIDTFLVDIKTPFNVLMKEVADTKYSRIPVYEETTDNIKGILYLKDLLPYLNEKENFNWTKLLREVYFVPETKKINDLLEDFRLKKKHIALVVDEYGGFSGLVTMEDILEEILGDIKDETDSDDELDYKKIADNIYLFDGKTLINDFSKIINIDDEIFDDIRGEAETLAGLILELKGELPSEGNIISYKHFDFKIEKVSLRRIVSIKVTNKIKND